MISTLATRVRAFAAEPLNLLVITLVVNTTVMALLLVELVTAALIVCGTAGVALYVLIRLYVVQERKRLTARREEHERFVAECERVRDELLQPSPGRL